MNTDNAKILQYSPDNGSTWMGPFTQKEIDQLKAAGIIEASYLIKDTSQPAMAAAQDAAVPGVEEIGGGAQGDAPPPMPPPFASQERDPNAAYFINLAGSQKGPYNIGELRQLITNHTVLPTTMCWTQGMENWKMAKDALPELFAQGGGEKLEKLEGFFITRFFADVFKRHQPNEKVDLFCCGSEKTTPPLESVQSNWPSPWIFARMLLVCLLLFFGFAWAFGKYENPTFSLGLIIVGNFGIPFCITILFFELNVRRDVPFTKVAGAMVMGGLISLVLTLLIRELVVNPREQYWAGPIEETAKLLTVLALAASLRNGKILTGLLLGCAVGSGFSAFESADYTLVCGGEAMIVRAITEPLGSHGLWTAITAGAYWFVQNLKMQAVQRSVEDRHIDFSILGDMRFLRIALIPVGLHMLWNSPLLDAFGIWKCVGIGIIGWIIALRLVQAGLNQIKAEKIKIKH